MTPDTWSPVTDRGAATSMARRIRVPEATDPLVALRRTSRRKRHVPALVGA